MSTNTSLQKTLGIWLISGITFFWLVGVIASGLVVRHEMSEVFDSALEETAQRILPLAVVDILNRESDVGNQRAPALQNHDEYLTYVVRDQNGNVLLQSHDVDINIFSPQPRNGFFESSTHRFYGASAVSDTIYIEIAEPIAHRQQAVLEATFALLLPLALLIPVSLFAVWWTIKWSLRRVLILQQSIETRGSGDLSPVIVDRLPQEFEPIVTEVNRLLDRLRRSLDAERSFTANSAHELRTPLATALAKLQRMKSQAQDAKVKSQATEIEGSLRDLSRLSEKLLELAKAEGGGAISEKPTDLLPILKMIVNDFRHQAPDQLLLDIHHNALESRLDPDAFAILVRNLLENALRHGDEGEPVLIELTDDGVLRVTNACPVLPPETLATLRNRFVRSNTKTVGSGIGLAIVEAIANGAGAKLSLNSPANGRNDGFEAAINISVLSAEN